MSKPWKWICAVADGFGNVVVCIRDAGDGVHYEYENLTAIITRQQAERVQIGFEAWVPGKVSLCKPKGLIRKDALKVMAEASEEAKKQALNVWSEIVNTETEEPGPRIVTSDSPDGAAAIARAVQATKKR